MSGPQPIKDPVSGHGRAVREARIAAGKTINEATEQAGVYTGLGSIVEHEADFLNFMRDRPRTYIEAMGFEIVVSLRPVRGGGSGDCP